MLVHVLALALAPAPEHRGLEDDDHALAHGHGLKACGCETAEADHPWTIDCSNAQVIRDATALLESETCDEARADDFEWGASFETPDASYKWVSQAVDGAYADPEMTIVLFAIPETGVDDLFAKRDAANALITGSCPSVETGGSIPKPTAAGVCVTLTFPTDPAVDFVATIDTTGVAHTAFFTAHVPTEFERDIHYLMQDVTDLTTATPNEPIADTGMYCKVQKNAAGIKECQQAFFILQSHHDYCTHDTLTRYEEELFHIWESKCVKCAIERGYVPTQGSCPSIDCTDDKLVQTAYFVLAGGHSKECTPANFDFAFEWGGVFDTPDSSYKWVSQAVDGAYADPEMKMALFAMTATNMGTLFMKQEEADTLLSGDCSTIVSDGGTLPVPTEGGVCVTMVFPTDPADDYVVTVDTTGVAHTAFFTAHVPTEFERTIHYLMQDVPEAQLGADSTIPNEPLNEVPAAGGGHEHRRLSQTNHEHRRLSQMAADAAFAKGKRPRRLADKGSCCNSAAHIGAWEIVVAYHDLCDHDDVPTWIEVGFHDYEASCEDYFCNAVSADYDGTACPADDDHTKIDFSEQCEEAVLDLGWRRPCKDESAASRRKRQLARLQSTEKRQARMLAEQERTGVSVKEQKRRKLRMKAFDISDDDDFA